MDYRWLVNTICNRTDETIEEMIDRANGTLVKPLSTRDLGEIEIRFEKTGNLPGWLAEFCKNEQARPSELKTVPRNKRGSKRERVET